MIKKYYLMLKQLVTYTKLRGWRGTTLSNHNSHHMDKSNRSMTVAAVAASEAIVTIVTIVININTFLRVPSKSFRACRAAKTTYGVAVGDEGHHGAVFVLSLYCNIYNMATVRGALQLLHQMAQ